MAIVIGCAALAFVLIIVGSNYSKKKNTPVVDSTAQLEKDGWYNQQDTYSNGIEDNGYVKGITAADYVTLCDYSAITVPAAEDPVSFIANYLMENSEVNVPESEVNRIKEMHLYSCNKEYSYAKENADSAYSSEYDADLSSVWAFYSCESEEEFNEKIATQAANDAKKYLIYQAICEKEGLSVSDTDKESWVVYSGLKKSDLEGVLYKFGAPYVNRMSMEHTVVDFIQK